MVTSAHALVFLNALTVLPSSPNTHSSASSNEVDGRCRYMYRMVSIFVRVASPLTSSAVDPSRRSPHFDRTHSTFAASVHWFSNSDVGDLVENPPSVPGMTRSPIT